MAAVLFSISNTTAGVAFSTVMPIEGFYISTPVLTSNQWLDPLLYRFRLQEALQKLVHFPGIGLEVRSAQRSTGNCLFVKHCVLFRPIGSFMLTNDIAQRNAVDSRNFRKIIYKSWLPFGPLPFVLELAWVGSLADSIGLIFFDLSNVGA